MAAFLVSTLLGLILTTEGIYLDTSPESGKSTYYGGNPSGGACGYAGVATSTFPFGYYSACGGTVFDSGYGCGKCYEITCIGPESTGNTACHCDPNTPSVIVSCRDQCPECAATHFDLDTSAMARIVGDGLSGLCGIITTTIRRVSCDYAGNIKIRSKSGTSVTWYGLHIDDVAGYGSVSSVQIKSTGSSSYATTCDKSGGASYWLCAGGYPLAAPLSVRLTGENGEVLTCDGCITSVDGGTEFDFGSNFGSSSAPSPTSSTTTTTTVSTGSTANPTSPTSGSVDYITVTNHADNQEWYLRFILDHIDASACGDSITDILILENGAWRTYNAHFVEANMDQYAWDNQGNSFQSYLPISIKIKMASAQDIDLWGIVENLTSGVTFTASQSICGTTPIPTAVTIPPTTAAPTPPTTAYPTAQSVCIDTSDTTNLNWRSYNNQIYLNGNRFNMKGLSWFGFETTNNQLHGLDVHTVDWYLDWMVANGFNAIRLPFSEAFINGGTYNQNLYKSFVQSAGLKGLLVMPDLHSKTAGGFMEGLNDIDNAIAIATWGTVAELLKDEYNVFIADVFNEPHDVSNSEWSDWIDFTKDVANAIWITGANWMIAIQGTNWECDVINCAWGENLEGVRNTGITFDETSYGSNRFVWSPHVYGADVTGNPHSASGWQSHWGYLVDGSYPANGAASVVGEFGTRYDTAEQKTWLNDLIEYLISVDQRNTFFWCLNPDSGDTGGLLMADWTTPEYEKLAALDTLQPNPSALAYNAAAQQVCVSFEGTTSPVTPAPTTPAPSTPSPVAPSPTTPAPSTPTPTTPGTPRPTPPTPRPTTPTVVPWTPSPTTPAPVTYRPITAEPTTSSTSSTTGPSASPSTSTSPTTSTTSSTLETVHGGNWGEMHHCYCNCIVVIGMFVLLLPL